MSGGATRNAPAFGRAFVGERVTRRTWSAPRWLHVVPDARRDETEFFEAPHA